jgi:AraC family transcriptional regulator, transcriptional activator of pobA
MVKIPVRQITTLQQSTSPAGTFSIRDLSTMTAEADLVQPIHRHDFSFLLALERGAGEHTIDFVKYDVTNNCIFVLRPGQVHELLINRGSSGFLLEFNGSFYGSKEPQSSRLTKAFSATLHRYDTHQFATVFSLLRDMMREFVSKAQNHHEALQAYLDLLLINMMRIHQQPACEVSPDSSLYAQERLGEFLKLVELHFTEFKEVSEYARLLNLSLYQLNSITKHTVGKSAAQLINEQVILESKRHLLATAFQIKEIADYLGFLDTSYFIRFFKKQTGFSPEAFRNKFK